MSRFKYGKPIIGLAGGVGSGKSTVARMLAQLGCAVIDADQLAAEALNEPDVAEQLRNWWSDAVFDANGRVNRRAVGEKVFADVEQLRRLEQLVHPKVHAARRRLRRRYITDPAVPAIVEDCPLLYEVGLDGETDVVIFVACDRETRLQRLAQTRNWTEAELAGREKNQRPLDIKASRADYIVNNDADEPKVFSHVRGVLSEIFQGPG